MQNSGYQELKPLMAKSGRDLTMEEQELPLPSKTKRITLMNDTGKNKRLNPLLITLACCLMIARRFHVWKMNLKFSALWKMLLITMTSFYENVHSSNTFTVVVTFALYFLGLVTHYCES